MRCYDREGLSQASTLLLDYSNTRNCMQPMLFQHKEEPFLSRYRIRQFTINMTQLYMKFAGGYGVSYSIDDDQKRALPV